MKENSQNTVKKEEILKNYSTNDKSRDRIISLFYDVFISVLEEVDHSHVVGLSKELEYQIYEKKASPAQIRSKYLNLKDKSNDLCLSIHNGLITVEEFVLMTAEEMKSKAQKRFDKVLIENNIENSQVAQMEEETDLFYCFKCKQRKCRYRQLQTRSADEPMTTYVFCRCGNTWKF